jgi:EAL domain-containing protein (putative c-di-GMP-specific phosphodiesterase class I)
MEIAIRDAIPLGEFVPYYEKQVDLASGEVLGFEMLARWHSPTFGLVGPDVFIPIAEEIGVIGELSESLIRQALRDAREWDPRLTLSVNVSPLQLRDPWFAQKLLKLLVEAQFPPQRLEVEITETSLHQNIAVVQSLVTSLRNQGITISLDDFGTGYSSFAQLRKLPFDRIKIDRSFVLAMQDDPDSRTIVETIALLGKGLGLNITAEGVDQQNCWPNCNLWAASRVRAISMASPSPPRPHAPFWPSMTCWRPIPTNSLWPAAVRKHPKPTPKRRKSGAAPPKRVDLSRQQA